MSPVSGSWLTLSEQLTIIGGGSLVTWRIMALTVVGLSPGRVGND